MNHNPITSLEFVANLAGRRYGVRVNRKRVYLQYSPYRALVDLADCLFKRECGYAFLQDFDVAGSKNALYQAMHRLKEEVKVGFRDPEAEVIEACGNCTYLLLVERENIEVNPNLIELSPVHLPTELVERLIKNAAKLRTAQHEAQPPVSSGRR